jgi:hypothetical protein
MEIEKLTNNELINLAVRRAGAERALSLEVINLIRAIEQRRCFLELGYGSLFDFVTKALGYEESAALRRIAAARMIRELPEIEAKISQGSLNLSSVNQAQIFFRREERLTGKKLSAGEKRRVLGGLENKSARKVKQALLDVFPAQALAEESARPVSSTHTELKVIIDEPLRLKLEKLKSLLSHQNPHMTYVELINQIADLALKKLEPVTKKSPATSPVQNGTRYIRQQVRKNVWRDYQICCAFTDPVTGQRCESRYQLQVHHVTPFAKGGASAEENLKLYCRAHNLHQAKIDFGELDARPQ